ncbi:MAG: sulfotransferase family protein [Gammaproteobacteria bacterium]
MRFCIVGTGRCGSSLLRNILNRNPDVFVFNETHWIPKLYERFGTEQGHPEEFLNMVDRFFHATGKRITDVDRDRYFNLIPDRRPLSVKAFCDGLGRLFAETEGKNYWADKTPDYGPWMRDIQSLWPDCKFLHMVRHGADVALSMSNHPGYRWLVSLDEDYWPSVAYHQYYRSVPTTEHPLEDFGQLWYRRLSRIRNASYELRNNSYQEFLLESFVDQPEQTLRRISKFVDIACTDNWLETAIGMIDSERIHAKKRLRRMDIFGPREIHLLKELGYETD